MVSEVDSNQFDPPLATRDRRKKLGDEATVAQVYGVIGNMYENDMLWPMLARHYRVYREMRWDPTISFARMLCTAPLVASGWTYEETDAAPNGARDMVERMMEPMRTQYVKTALEGHIDYGWAGYEQVLDVNSEGFIITKKLKPLLQDRTQILVDPRTGAFWGLRQWAVYLYKRNRECLCVTLDLEGTNFYGSPLMENVRTVYEKWGVIEAAATRYDTKIAGTTIVVHYPLGQSKMNGTLVDNYEIAKNIINMLQASGAVACPTKLVPFDDDSMKGEDAWRIEMLSDNSQGRAAFTDRQRYLDSLKVRGLGLPERAVLEGQYGTKAEADAHGDFAIMNLELRHIQVVDHVNRHVIDACLADNFGDEARGTVFAQAVPLADDKKFVLKDVYKAILTNAQTGLSEWDQIDTESLRDSLGIPTKKDPEETAVDQREEAAV